MDPERKRKRRFFHGGLQPPEHKHESNGRPITPSSLPPQLVLPLQQHIGEPAEPVVEPGDKVLKGQVIATASAYVSVPMHAPTSGTITAIENRPVPHTSGLSAPCIVIDVDGRDEWIQHHAIENYQQLDPSALRNRIRDAGIVGLGGAGFPSFIKLNPGPEHKIDILILNGAECEPYITCDDMLMRERADQIIAGAKIMRHALQARVCIIGIENNKPEALAAMRKAGRDVAGIDIMEIPTVYPTGGEKQLIKVLTGREVPSNGLPASIGIICHNVGTATAVNRAIHHGEPLISRIVTMTGSNIEHPCNLEVLFGTPFNHLLAQCGEMLSDSEAVIMGGPMMGFPVHTTKVPVTKTANCILAGTSNDFSRAGQAMPCIRCGKCAEVCPVNLLPQQLFWHARAHGFDHIQDYNLFDCIECGCCAYVCPSNIPLVQYYRFAKTEIWEQERDKKKSNIARERHEFRQERLERDKQERAERLKKKREAAKAATSSDAQAAKKAEILAAMERVEAKKQAASKQTVEKPE